MTLSLFLQHHQFMSLLYQIISKSKSIKIFRSQKKLAKLTRSIHLNLWKNTSRLVKVLYWLYFKNILVIFFRNKMGQEALRDITFVCSPAWFCLEIRRKPRDSNGQPKTSPAGQCSPAFGKVASSTASTLLVMQA